MAYVAVTGGQEAIEEAEKLVKSYRLTNSEFPLDPSHIQKQMRLLIDRVMSEAGMYSPSLAALALKQGEGDTFEAVFLLRAYRSTLERNHYSEPVDTNGMRVIRRISSSFKDVPGGQVLGPTYDYTHRLLNFDLTNEQIEDFLHDDIDPTEWENEEAIFQKVIDILRNEDW